MGAGDPLYRRISQQLCESITDGVLAPGARLPNGEALARRYNTSVNTVTRAMRLLTNQGLIRRVPGLGTFVAAEAQTPVGVLGFVGSCCRGFAEVCALGQIELEFKRRLASASDSFERFLGLDSDAEQRPHELLALARAKGVAGVFCVPPEGGLPATAECLSEMQRLVKAGIQVVLLDRDVVEPPQRSEFDLVTLHNANAGFVLGAHLAAQGATRVLFAARQALPPVVMDRLAGLRAGLASRPGPEIEVRVERLDPAGTREVIRQFRPDAMVGKDDAVAAQLMQLAYDLNMRIPDEVMVAGFDDSPVAADMVVPLTSVSQPIGELVEAALILMRSRLDSSDRAPRTMMIRGRLSARRSTRAMPG
jgi:DNA-binding LacI/PurR family transcriptional regulator